MSLTFPALKYSMLQTYSTSLQAYNQCSLTNLTRFLLVSTDTPRLLMLRTVDWSVARSFFATAEQFHNPVSAWHRDNHYIYVAATAAEVSGR